MASVRTAFISCVLAALVSACAAPPVASDGPLEGTGPTPRPSPAAGGASPIRSPTPSLTPSPTPSAQPSDRSAASARRDRVIALLKSGTFTATGEVTGNFACGQITAFLGGTMIVSGSDYALELEFDSTFATATRHQRAVDGRLYARNEFTSIRTGDVDSGWFEVSPAGDARAIVDVLSQAPLELPRTATTQAGQEGEVVVSKEMPVAPTLLGIGNPTLAEVVGQVGLIFEKERLPLEIGARATFEFPTREGGVLRGGASFWAALTSYDAVTVTAPDPIGPMPTNPPVVLSPDETRNSLQACVFGYDVAR